VVFTLNETVRMDPQREEYHRGPVIARIGDYMLVVRVGRGARGSGASKGPMRCFVCRRESERWVGMRR